MLLWVILGFGWLGILLAAVSLFRLAGYADKKIRRLTIRRFPERPRRRNDQAA
jgi:type IV secretory pathway TrbD component